MLYEDVRLCANFGCWGFGYKLLQTTSKLIGEYFYVKIYSYLRKDKPLHSEYFYQINY